MLVPFPASGHAYWLLAMTTGRLPKGILVSSAKGAWQRRESQIKGVLTDDRAETVPAGIAVGNDMRRDLSVIRFGFGARAWVGIAGQRLSTRAGRIPAVGAPIRNLDGNRSGHEMDSAPQHRDAADRHRIAARPVVVDLFDPGHRTRFTPGPRRRHSDQAGPGRGRSLSGHAAGLAEATWTGEVMQWAA